VGWIFQYALVDRSGRNDLAQLRALQDWFLKYELKSLEGVAEVATVGGMVKQYQVVVDPHKLAAYGLTFEMVRMALMAANQETGGSVLELAEAEYMVRASGYLKTLDDFRAVPLMVMGGVPIRLGDVAVVQTGPEMRRGIAELDGQGEVTGGVVILRAGANAQRSIAAVKARLEALKPSLPPGVEVVVTYDRSELIERAVNNLATKLLEEFIVVALVCAVFLWHAQFAGGHHQPAAGHPGGLRGDALAGHQRQHHVAGRHCHRHRRDGRCGHRDDRKRAQEDRSLATRQPGPQLQGEERWRVVTEAAVEVGPALFFSLLIITLSFIPVFTLQAQEGRLFGPLAYTKTYAMAAAALLSATLIPVLMGWWIRGRIPDENRNPISRVLIALYRPVLEGVLRWPKATLLLAALLVLATTLWPMARLGGEFLPPLDEGDLLYMPTALPGLSAAKASELLQQTDRMIKTVPEVARVFGKAGRAETATDPAPMEMFETTIQLKPRDQWRPGMTPEKLVEELDAAVKVPGLANIWIPPIRNRIDMLATGIKSPIGVKVAGTDGVAIDRIAQQVEQVARKVDGVSRRWPSA
jgi:Cu(I)/Ag(I) efflux system membrane protein CusA/SilA